MSIKNLKKKRQKRAKEKEKEEEEEEKIIGGGGRGKGRCSPPLMEGVDIMDAGFVIHPLAELVVWRYPPP